MVHFQRLCCEEHFRTGCSELPGNLEGLSEIYFVCSVPILLSIGTHNIVF